MLEPRQWLGWVASAAVVAVAVATAGWGNDTSVRRHQPPPSVPPTSTSAVRPVALVARADLTLSDLPGGYHEVQARSGSDLDPGDRLHLCGAAVPPAAGRVAGHRRAYLGPGRRRVRTEIAVYADGRADRALDALRTLAPRCSRPVPPGGVELPSVLALHVALDRTTADPERREVVVLRSGEALAVLEVDGAAPGRTVELARTVAARLDGGAGPVAGPGTSAAALASVALRPGDLPSGFVVQADLYGRELDGNPARDACGRLLAGDTHRRAARQLVLTGSGRRVTGEVASYQDGGAAAVLQQLREAVAACPHGPEPHRLRGIQSLDRRYSVAGPDADGTSLTVLLTVTDRAGHRRRTEVVHQRRGDVLSVLTVDPVDGHDDPLVRRTAAVLAARLDRQVGEPDRVESLDGHNVVHGIPLEEHVEGSRPPPSDRSESEDCP